MKNILLLNKKEGETPLQALDNFRRKNIRYKDAKMTYAGRLDPMARGLLLVLSGEEVKKKEKYLALPKEYEFDILFGFSTDTYDILGKIENSTILTNSRMDIEKKRKENLKYFTGKFLQKYPMYSSKTVLGRQLFKYARAGEDVEAPTRAVNVKALKFTKSRTISRAKLLANISKRIKKVNGDFRQKEILDIWNKYLRTSTLKYEQGESLLIGSFKIKCSSGTYVRGIANALGDRIGIPALAFSIKRTKIGKWK